MPEISQRGQTVPCPPWWLEKARSALREIGMTQKQLADKLDVSDSAVSRCLSGEVPTLELINAISDLLKIRRPVLVAATEDEAFGPADTSPKENDSTELVIRKNLIRFREEAGYDQIAAADATDTPYETLRSFELGTQEPSNSDLKRFAEAYGHKPGDFFELQPPKANLDDVPWIHFRVRHGYTLSEEDIAELQTVVKRIESRFRIAKKSQLEQFKKAKARRKGPRGTEPP